MTDRPKELETLRNTDIYLVDQIWKGRYTPGQKILDAGCGGGRNMRWFIHQEIEIYGIDQNQQSVAQLQAFFPQLKDRIKVANLMAIPYSNNMFDHVICNAVLHFAADHSDFNTMLKELARVTMSGGSIFIRMTSDIGISNIIQPQASGRCSLPDGSERYLLTTERLQALLTSENLSLLEPIKSVVVYQKRSMATLVLKVL